MKSTGIVRELDTLGRIVIPKETRDVLGIAVGDPLEFLSGDNGEIIMRAYQTKCVFCFEDDNRKLKKIKGKLVCDKCRQHFTRMEG